MIDTQQTTTCKACGKPIIQVPGGHRVRVYCNAVCKIRDRRRRTAEQEHQTQAAKIETALAQVATRDEQVAALQARVRELEAHLLAISDVNERFRNDIRVRTFAPWLEKRAEYYATSPFGQRFLADRDERLLPPSASRAHHAAYPQVHR